MFTPKIVVCLREGYSWPQLRSDIAAGTVVGLVALPLAMAFAIASGMPPERGLFTAIIAGFLISALGGSRVQIGGPTGAFVVIVSGIVTTHGYPGLALATLMAGVILILMGASRLGDMVKFIPYPVTTGFTSGIAVIIFSSQVKDFLGLPMAAAPADFVAKWMEYGRHLSHVNPWALGLAAGTCALIGIWPSRWSRVPASLVALIAASTAAAIFHAPVETIGSRFGGIPHGLPAPALPPFNWAALKPLFLPATTIAMLAAIESLLSAVVADGMIGGRHRSNMELIAQGIANLASPLFGGIPATGAIARTATNVKNGGRTPVAGIVHAVVLLAILLTAGPLAAKVPLAALAGILVVVSYHMSEWRSFGFVLKGPRSDILVLLTTFGLTVFVDLTAAVCVGMVLAAFLFMRQMADLTQVRSWTGEGRAGDAEQPRAINAPPGVEVFSVHGSFFFGAAHKLIEVGRFVSKKPRALVLDMTDVWHIDASGLHALRQLHKECGVRGTRFVVAGVREQPLQILRSARLDHLLGSQNLYSSLQDAVKDLASPAPVVA